jgi:hypothetical protein
MTRPAIRLLFAASLIANCGCIAAWWFVSLRPRGESAAHPASRDGTAAANAAAARKSEALMAALTNGDAAAQRAAGVPEEIVRQLIVARAFSRMTTIAQAHNHRPPTDAYWRNSRALRPPPTREERMELRAAERDFELAMRDAFGEGWLNERQSSRYTFLPPDRQAKLRQIERDYEEMQRDIAMESEDVQLRGDHEKQKLLQTELERDIAAALTPAEREQLELRTSPSAQLIIEQFGDVLQSEEEYKRLYALRKAFDEQFKASDDPFRARTPEENRAYEEAQRKLNDDLRAAIGEDRWAAVSRVNDGEYRALGTLTARLGLPNGTPDTVYQVRDAFAVQSMAIQHDATLSADDRHNRFVELANQAKTELRAKLGPDGEETYSRQAGWIQTLQNGRAFVTNPRLLPPGSARPHVGATFFPLPPPSAPTAAGAP